MDLFSKQYHAPGTMPGTLNQPSSSVFRVSLVEYNSAELIEHDNVLPAECRDALINKNTSWIHVQGNPSAEALRSLAESFGIHDLHIEDIHNTGQRPKMESSDEQLFIILSLPVLKDDHVVIEQVSLIIMADAVISFCTGEAEPFALVRERLHKSMGKIRKRGADYLLYTLIDTVIDFGYPLLEVYAEKLESTEDALANSATQSDLQNIHRLRRELLLLRRTLWPQREVLNRLLRNDESALLNDETLVYLRDCYDHNISIIELLETYHEISGGLLELYLSSVSRRLNEVMQVLTVIATLFIPPTFVVGVYGMNFDTQSPWNMPELHSPYGYLVVWGIIVMMVVGMLMYFRRKNWF